MKLRCMYEVQNFLNAVDGMAVNLCPLRLLVRQFMVVERSDAVRLMLRRCPFLFPPPRQDQSNHDDQKGFKGANRIKGSNRIKHTNKRAIQGDHSSMTTPSYQFNSRTSIKARLQQTRFQSMTWRHRPATQSAPPRARAMVARMRASSIRTKRSSLVRSVNSLIALKARGDLMRARIVYNA